ARTSASAHPATPAMPATSTTASTARPTASVQRTLVFLGKRLMRHISGTVTSAHEPDSVNRTARRWTGITSPADWAQRQHHHHHRQVLQRSGGNGNSCQAPANGLSTAMSSATKSLTFRVTSVQPCTCAVAPSRASTVDVTSDPAWPHRRAISPETGTIRPAKASDRVATQAAYEDA